MNQYAPKSAFQTATLLPNGAIGRHNPIFFTDLRALSAQFQMHNAIVHRLCPPDIRLIDTTYSSTVRNLERSNWTLGNLICGKTLGKLLSGNSAVSWFNQPIAQAGNVDPLSRLNIQFGASVPFHNALGNHVALTLFDSAFSNVDLTKLTQMALPLIDEILSLVRAKNAGLIALSKRETDCLQWVAAGKTSLETAIILGLSPHTVNQYLTEATVKLKAVNRTHAVTKAVRLGLINLSAV